MRSLRAARVLGGALFLVAAAAACGRPSSGTSSVEPREAGAAIRFIEDDYPRALAEARARGVPLFVDAWASWCHTCLSMRAFVFGDASLSGLADRYVWLALDTERESSAPLVSKLGVKVLPTLYVIDSRDERVLLAWPGSLTATELAGLLGDTRDGAGPPGPLAVDALVATASRDGRLVECAATAAREAPTMPPGTALADVLRSGIECAEGLPESAGADELGALAVLADHVVADPSQPILADDRSDLYDYVVAAYHRLGREGDASRATQAWAAFLDEQAARAPTPSARAVFDAHRLRAYQALNEPDRAVPMLEASARDFPTDYNPPARLAAAYLSMKRFPDALSAVRTALGLAYGGRKLRLYSLEADVLAASGDLAGERAALAEGLAFSQSVPLVEGYPKEVDAMTKRLAALKAPDLDAGRPAPPRKRLGAPCSGPSSKECAPGLVCCETGFIGHCGGVAPPLGERVTEPCVMTRSCAPAPCSPMSLPP